MAGSLLRSGSIAEHRPLGQEGNPVYRSARQLREAIRLQLGSDVADHLAFPQPNEAGDRFDWYAPMEGMVVPWSAASAEERTKAHQELKAIQARLGDFSARLKAQDSSGQKGDNRERKTLSRLLEDVLRFPGPEYVYLVEGRPVITFWGFDDNLEPGVDSVERLRPIPVAAPVLPPEEAVVMAAAPVVEQPIKKKRRWWWLLLPLLLLLLLLLLFLLLHSCGTRLPGKLHDLIPGQHREPDHKTGQSSQHVPDQVAPDLGGGTMLHPDGSGAALPIPEEGSAPQPIDGAHEAAPDQQVQPEEPPSPAPEENNRPGQPPQPDQHEAAPPQVPPDTDTQGPLKNLPPSSGARQGNALVIPKEAMQNGSTGFLDGRWRAATGLQEARTGQPIELEYDFQHGQGQVSIRQADGSVCRGEVAAAMAGHQLKLSDRTAPICPNGTRYQPAQVNCQPGEDGLAVCSGSYANGQRFAVKMKRVVQ